MSRTCNLVRKSTVDRPHPFGIDNNNHILFELHTVIRQRWNLSVPSVPSVPAAV